ncbi:DUF131 domain-containing protein [Candidatus Bathyarchaeota archaeon]|nr:DUF131 domain-containing protein [Candidatus Bathyarchaeota archaeon]
MTLVQIGLALLMVGFVLVICGIIITVIQNLRWARRRIGGAILIGPFPIVFGDKDLIKYSFILLAIMIVLTLVLLLLPPILASL